MFSEAVAVLVPVISLHNATLETLFVTFSVVFFVLFVFFVFFVSFVFDFDEEVVKNYVNKKQSPELLKARLVL